MSVEHHCKWTLALRPDNVSRNQPPERTSVSKIVHLDPITDSHRSLTYIERCGSVVFGMGPEILQAGHVRGQR